MMSMLMMNMQSSIQMLPLLQQRQMQQKQNSMQFQTYISQMQALNSMLHTLSYGTPLSELNKLHSGVKNQFESYNNEVSNRLKGVINQVKDMNKATELEKERLLHQLNDEEMRSEDDDEEFKDELDKLEEKVEAQYRAKANTNQAISVGAAPEFSTTTKQKSAMPLQNAGLMSQNAYYSQPQQFGFPQASQPGMYNPMSSMNPYGMNMAYPPYGFELQYDTTSGSSRREEKKPKKTRDDSSSTEKVKKKKKQRKDEFETESKVSALDSPRDHEQKDKKTKPDPMSLLFPGLPNMDGMDPMMKNMYLMNMLSQMNEKDRKKKKKKKSHKRDKDEVGTGNKSSEEKPKMFHHPSHLAFPDMDQLLQASAATQSRRKPGDKAQAAFTKDEGGQKKKRPTFSDTQSLDYSKR